MGPRAGQTAAGLDAAEQGNAAATRYFADAKRIADQAAAVQSIKGAVRFDGPIKIADDRADADRPLHRRCNRPDRGYGETVTVRLARRPSGVRVRSSTAPFTATGPV